MRNMIGKRKGREKEKERRRGLDILKNYRVTMTIRNRKSKKHCEENVICWKIKWNYKRGILTI